MNKDIMKNVFTDRDKIDSKLPFTPEITSLHVEVFPLGRESEVFPLSSNRSFCDWNGFQKADKRQQLYPLNGYLSQGSHPGF